MKITDPEVIKNGEKDLIASVQEDLDPETVREILKERMTVAALSSKGGQIVVHENDIAFRLDFQVNLSGSLLFDRDGNLIEDLTADASASEDEEFEPDMDLDDGSDDSLEGLEDIAPARQLTADPEDELDAPPTDDLSIDLPEYDIDDDLDVLIGENEPDDQFPDETDPAPKDLDDDIDDILKESREFWEQKEDS